MKSFAVKGLIAERIMGGGSLWLDKVENKGKLDMANFASVGGMDRGSWWQMVKDGLFLVSDILLCRKDSSLFKLLNFFEGLLFLLLAELFTGVDNILRTN